MDLVVAILGILVCLAGMYREGYKSGREDGREEGYSSGALMMLKSFADGMTDGTIRIENGHLLLAGASFLITDSDGNHLNDIDLSKLDIRETEK